MFSRRSHSIDPSRQRSGRAGGSRKQRSFKDAGISKNNLKTSISSKVDALSLASQQQLQQSLQQQRQVPPTGDTLTSPIVTLFVGRDQRVFAAHEDVLRRSPYFEAACRGQILYSDSRRISLPDEEPDIFSSILEYLYKGDYYPKLDFNKRRNTWQLEDAASEDGTRSAVESVVYNNGVPGPPVLKDTVIYCTADKYGLDELKKLALRKQGLQAGIQVGTILSSARYAYANTPESDSKLRAHYLSLIIRCRDTFKRSGSMQNEMQIGGALFFDLFVALCNHCDDLASHTKKSPR